MDDAAVLALAGRGAFAVVTAHRGDQVQLVFGDPAALFGVDAEALQSGGYVSLVIGALPVPCAWTEECASSVYLIRDSQGGAQWLESRSVAGPDGVLVVNTRVLSVAPRALIRSARLGIGGGLLGPLAHELNNIVQGVSSAAFLFRDCIETGDPIEMEDLDQLSETGKELAHLSAQLQSFARVDESESESLELVVMLERCVQLLRAVGRLKTLEHRLDISESLPPLQWRRFELDFLLLALIGNAADAALVNPTGASIGIRAVAAGDTVQIEIRDSGETFSIAESQVPFASSKPPHRHLGLGLSGVTSILALRGGTIELVPCESGTCVRVTLPLSC